MAKPIIQPSKLFPSHRMSEIRLMRREGLDEAAMRRFFQSFAKNIISEIDLISQFRGHSHIVSIEDYQVIEEKTDTIGWCLPPIPHQSTQQYQRDKKTMISSKNRVDISQIR